MQIDVSLSDWEIVERLNWAERSGLTTVKWIGLPIDEAREVLYAGGDGSHLDNTFGTPTTFTMSEDESILWMMQWNDRPQNATEVLKRQLAPEGAAVFQMLLDLIESRAEPAFTDAFGPEGKVRTSLKGLIDFKAELLTTEKRFMDFQKQADAIVAYWGSIETGILAYEELLRRANQTSS